MVGRLIVLVMSLSVAGTPCFGQSQGNPPAQSAGPAATDANSSSPGGSGEKKVWTNENVANAKGPVSVVGNKRNHGYPMDRPADAATVSRIKGNLEKLQKQLDDVNSKLKLYKEFQEGEPVSKGERDMSKAYSRTPVDQQMTQLENKKKQLEGQIGDLLDEARKSGIDPGQLR